MKTLMLIVDTSVAARWVIGTANPALAEETQIALSLLPRGLAAPDQLVAEFANAMLNKVRAGEIGEKQAREAVAALPQVVDFLPTARFADSAIEISLDLRHPAYDCFFLAAAMALDTQVVTADGRFANRCLGTPFEPFIARLNSRADWTDDRRPA